MRLKTKIILICCISVLFSSVVCSIAAFSLVKNISLDAAEGQGFQNAMAGFSDLGEKVNRLSNEELDEKVIQYILKKQDDEMLVCFSSNREEGSEIYNSTVFDKDDFEKLHFHSIPDASVDMAELVWESRHFFVYRQSDYQICVIYKLEDVTYVWERMRLIAVSLVVMNCVVTAVVCLIVFLIVKKVLRPLRNLNDGAKQIARGEYDERIVVEREDEIGELSRNFNQMAEAVQLRIWQLREEESKRTLFMGNLTHELKTPMTAISGYAKTLLTVKLSEEDREEALSYIYEESCRLERLSKKMMNLLLLEEDEQIELKEVSAKALFQNAEEACRASLTEDGIRLECHEDGGTFLVDADLITEVLINLIDNARKASRRGDKIILSAVGNTMEVRDFGTGIPEEEKERILEPFYRIDKSRSRKNGGAGLGLAITSLILRRHNCQVRIESRVGEGTRMILQFV